MKLQLAFAVGLLLTSAAANASLDGTQVTGSLTFGGGSTNYFLNTNGFVPAGYGNSAGQPVTIGGGTEFGFQDGANTDTANFAGTQLIITDISVGGGITSTYSFTSLTAGSFAGLWLDSSNFPEDFTYNLVGDTITIAFDSFATGGTFETIFNLTAAPAVPEPATWMMMLLGFGAIGFAVRRARAKERLQLA